MMPMGFKQQFLTQFHDFTKLCKASPSWMQDCTVENAHILELFLLLSMSIFFTLFMYTHMREDKEELLTPLCPQLVVKHQALDFKFDLGPNLDEIKVWTSDDKLICKLNTSWPDARQSGPSGAAATLRLQDPYGHTLCCVVLRSVAVRGQGICFCRASLVQEIFGFLEPTVAAVPEQHRYVVQHRSKTMLYMLTGHLDSEPGDVTALSASGVEVCTLQRVRSGTDTNSVVGRCSQNVDAGLLICSAIASVLHQRLAATRPQPTCWDVGTSADGHQDHGSDPFLPNASLLGNDTHDDGVVSTILEATSEPNRPAQPESGARL